MGQVLDSFFVGGGRMINERSPGTRIVLGFPFSNMKLLLNPGKSRENNNTGFTDKRGGFVVLWGVDVVCVNQASNKAEVACLLSAIY